MTSAKLFVGPDARRCLRSEKVSLPSQGQRGYDLHYFGGGVEFAQALGRSAHGGQVVLSESSWASIQDQLPGSCQVVCTTSTTSTFI